jgi:hypothetical protein
LLHISLPGAFVYIFLGQGRCKISVSGSTRHLADNRQMAKEKGFASCVERHLGRERRGILCENIILQFLT